MIKRGTGVPPVIHGQDAHATFTNWREGSVYLSAYGALPWAIFSMPFQGVRIATHLALTGSIPVVFWERRG